MAQAIETPAEALALSQEDCTKINEIAQTIVAQLQKNIAINYMGKVINDTFAFSRNTPRKYFVPVMDQARVLLQTAGWRFDYFVKYQDGWDYDLCVYDYRQYLAEKASEDALKAKVNSRKLWVKLAFCLGIYYCSCVAVGYMLFH